MNATRWMRLGAIVALTVAALPAAATNSITVGELIVGIAQLREVDTTDPRVAADALAGAGVALPADLQLAGPLTEADVTRVARAFGLKLTTTRPEAFFDEAQLNRFLTTFRDDLATTLVREHVDPSAHGEGPAFDPFSKGKGKGKGVISPTDP